MSQAIILTIFPTDFPPPKNFNELEDKELPLLSIIPEALTKLFNKLFKAYLKISDSNYLEPEESLKNLLIKFNNENAELRYPNNGKNPYFKGKYGRTNGRPYEWRRKASFEFYPYYDGVLTLLSSIRNIEAHREDAFVSAQFDLAKRKVTEPISGIESPANYLILSGLVILSIYAFIEILQRWIDTQARLGKI